MSIYQIKTIKDGKAVDVTAAYHESFLKYPLTRKFDSIPNKSSYCEVVSSADGMATVRVVAGTDAGLTRTVSVDMLVKPDVFPCFAGSSEKWISAVSKVFAGKYSEEVAKVIDNALGEKKTKVTSAFNSDDVKDTILSLKAIQEVCEPYLGPVGMVMALTVMKNRIFKAADKENA